jgi:hypothetical protein
VCVAVSCCIRRGSAASHFSPLAFIVGQTVKTERNAGNNKGAAGEDRVRQEFAFCAPACTQCCAGETVTWDDMRASRLQFCDYLNKLDENSPVPVKTDADGRFPVPVPGEVKEV